MLSLLPKTNFCSSVPFMMLSTTALNLDQFNPFPHDKILDQTKLKAFADDKLKIKIISVCDRVENIVRKGEIACTSNKLLSQRQQKVSFIGNGLKCC